MAKEQKVKLTEAPGPGIFDSTTKRLERGEEDIAETQTPDWASRLTAVPDSLRHFALPEWTYPLHHGGSGNQLGMSYHTDQLRWIKVTAYVLARKYVAGEGWVEEDGFVDIPLIDNDGLPLADPAIPPMVNLRTWAVNSTIPADYVTTPESTPWSDYRTTIRATEGLTGAFHSYRLKLARDPYPHWILRLRCEFTEDGSVTVGANMMADVFTNGCLIHNGTTIESGTSLNHKHYRVKLIWDQQAPMSAPVKATYDQRSYGTGIIYCAENSNVSLYLATPDGLSTDTNAFASTTVPCVRVYGINPINSTPSSLEDDRRWKPCTAALGINAPYTVGTTYHSQAWRGCYYSNLMWWSAAGKWRLMIFNSTSSDVMVLNRHYAVAAIGVRA